jgi:hypothetical protein
MLGVLHSIDLHSVKAVSAKALLFWILGAIFFGILMNTVHVRLFIMSRTALEKHGLSLSWWEFFHRTGNYKRLKEAAPTIHRLGWRWLLFSYVLVGAWMLAGIALGLIMTCL